jgi:CheY-like chemotaxis protein/anti-anti-sigma regulatory factor
MTMRLKVLTVDDSKTIRMVVKKAFQPFDCEIFEGENGVMGLAIAAREKPDLIVLDITMPVMDGKEMLAKLRGEPTLKDIPVIMLTAESGKDNVMEIVKMGVKDYMIKPFKGEELIQRVNKIVKLEPKKQDDLEGVDSEKDKLKKIFFIDDGIQYLVLPAAINKEISAEVSDHIKEDMVKAAASGKKKLIFDLRKLPGINISIIKLIIMVIEKCRETQTRLRVVGNAKLSDELKGFQETAELPVHLNVEEVKASF